MCFLSTALFSGCGAPDSSDMLSQYLKQNAHSEESIPSAKEKFASLLSNRKWVLSHTNENIKDPSDVTFMTADIDGDNTNELIMYHSTCMADMSLTIVKYSEKTGEITCELVGCDHGGFAGYSADKKMFFTSSAHMGSSYSAAYEYKNNEPYLTKVCTWNDYQSYSYNMNSQYTFNGTKMSQSEYRDNINNIMSDVRYGNVEFHPITSYNISRYL